MKKKIGKLNFKKRLTDVAISAGTGAAVQIVSEAVLQENPETMDYILAGAGVVLPEIVKSPMIETVATTIVGIAAYRLSERNDLAGTIGIKNTDGKAPATSGMRGWKPVSSKPSKNMSGAGNSSTVAEQPK